jgi:hypothetical protein
VERRHQDGFCKDNQLAITEQKLVTPMDVVILRQLCLLQRVSINFKFVLNWNVDFNIPVLYHCEAVIIILEV